MKQWPAGVNSRFAEVTENDILRMQNITIPNILPLFTSISENNC